MMCWCVVAQDCAHTKGNVVARLEECLYKSAHVHTATGMLSLLEVPERNGLVNIIAALNSPRDTELVPAIIHGGYHATGMSIREVFENMQFQE